MNTNYDRFDCVKDTRHRQTAACGASSELAERAGFEPAEVLPSHDFQSCALGRTMLPLHGFGLAKDYTIIALPCQIWAIVKAVGSQPACSVGCAA